MRQTFNRNLVIFSLVFPGVLIFIFATMIPIILSIYYGMTDMHGIVSQPKFIAFVNFINIITKDNVFWLSLLHALMLGLAAILFQHPLCFILAILIDRMEGIAEKIFRVLFFVPCVISVMVTSKMFVNIFNPDFGLLNNLLKVIGLDFLKQSWLGDPKLAIWSVGFIVIWQGFGYGLLIYYSGIKGIPEELYEAAKIDGASGIMMYTKITLPLLSPVIKVAVTISIITCLKQMETVYLTTNGGPGNTTQFLANYLYIKAFNSLEYGYANAISVLFVIVCLLATYFSNKLVKDESN